jgi:hypothetical protein
MAASWRSVVSRAGVDEADARVIHSPKLLENKKRVAEIRTKTGNGSLAFFIKPLPPSEGDFCLPEPLLPDFLVKGLDV